MQVSQLKLVDEKFVVCGINRCKLCKICLRRLKTIHVSILKMQNDTELDKYLFEQKPKNNLLLTYVTGHSTYSKSKWKLKGYYNESKDFSFLHKR